MKLNPLLDRWQGAFAGSPLPLKRALASIPLKPAAAPPRDYSAILEILRKNEFLPGTAVQRQLVTHLRELIHRKKLTPHTRMPPLRMLANLWETNYRTVQVAVSQLAAEGLMVRSPMNGTFISPVRNDLRRVCIYLNSEHLEEENFISNLNMILFSELSRRGVVVTTFFDHRPPCELGTAPPEVVDMVRHNAIDAVIAGSIFPQNTGWLLKIGVPTASIMFNREERQIETDFASFARQAMDEVKRVGASSVTFLHNLNYLPPSPLLTEMRSMAEKCGIRLMEATSTRGLREWESYGRQACELALQIEPRPTVMVVYPDSLITGVTHALLQNRVRVPEDVQLISHRNYEMPFILPFPVTWLTTRIRDYVLALIRQVDNQIAATPLKATQVDVEIDRPRGSGFAG